MSKIFRLASIANLCLILFFRGVFGRCPNNYDDKLVVVCQPQDDGTYKAVEVPSSSLSSDSLVPGGPVPGEQCSFFEVDGDKCIYFVYSIPFCSELGDDCNIRSLVGQPVKDEPGFVYNEQCEKVCTCSCFLGNFYTEPIETIDLEASCSATSTWPYNATIAFTSGVSYVIVKDGEGSSCTVQDTQEFTSSIALNPLSELEAYGCINAIADKCEQAGSPIIPDCPCFTADSITFPGLSDELSEDTCNPESYPEKASIGNQQPLFSGCIGYSASLTLGCILECDIAIPTTEIEAAACVEVISKVCADNGKSNLQCAIPEN